MLRRVGETVDSKDAVVKIKDASFPTPFVSALEYNSPVHFPVSWTIHQPIWYSLQRQEHWAQPVVLLQPWEPLRSRCLWQSPVVRYLWEPTHTSEMHRTLW